MTTLHEGEEGGESIRGEEEGAPQFGLADVDAFVGAGEVQENLVAGEDDVAKGHGGGAAFEEGEVFQEEGGEAAVEFENAAVELGVAAGEHGEGEEEQTEDCRGQGPEVEGQAGAAHGGL